MGTSKTSQSVELVKGDSRILGSTPFVLNVLERAQQAMTNRYEARIAGTNIMSIEKEICALYDIVENDLKTAGRQRKVVEARSIICFLAVELLGIASKDLALRYGITEPAVSYLLKKGCKAARTRNLINF
ncbi:MAG: hypothetical protein ACYDHW_02700 [Syntrophorhabdaceae bacterium]